MVKGKNDVTLSDGGKPMTSGFNFLADVIQLGTRSHSSPDSVRGVCPGPLLLWAHVIRIRDPVQNIWMASK